MADKDILGEPPVGKGAGADPETGSATTIDPDKGIETENRVDPDTDSKQDPGNGSVEANKPHAQGSNTANEGKGETEITLLVKNPHTNESCLAHYNKSLPAGTRVVIPTRYGLDIGLVLGEIKSRHDCSNCSGRQTGADDSTGDRNRGNPGRGKNNNQGSRQSRKKKKEKKSEIQAVERIATERDIQKYEKNRVKELEALTLCKEKIKYHKLDMKLVSAHYLLGESKILFFFTADSRVDFRELVKDLVSIFKMRIELRQIGVRDESRVLGGLAVCGRDYCCHSITDKLNPVSIKMAKEQNLSLNSMKISGPCGRLLCCLSYEYDFYREEKRKLPSEGSRLKVGENLVKISEVNILSKKIYLSSQDGRIMVVPFGKVSYNESSKRWVIDSDFIKEMLSN